MGDIKDAADNAWRDWTIPNTPSSGEHEPLKSDIRAVMTVVDTKVETIEAGNGSGFLTYPTLTAMNADTAQADGTTAQNLEDDNLYYWNDGGSAWTLIGPSPAAELASIDGRVDALEAVDAGARIDDLEAADTTLDGRLDTLEALNAGSRLTSLESADTALDGRLDAIEALDVGDRLTTVESVVYSEPAVSELAAMWSATVSGEPAGRTPISTSLISQTTQDGLVITLSGAGALGPRAVYRLIPGHKYEVLAAARRATNPTDPLGDAVSLRAAWLNASKGPLALESLESFNLSISSGLHIFRKVVSLSAGDEVDEVAPNNTVYFTPFMQTYGTNGVTRILPYVRVTDLTSNTLVSADVSGLNTRVAALESLDAGDRLDALESVTVVVTPDMSPYQASPGQVLLVDTRLGAVTVDLPAEPSEEDAAITFTDAAGTWATNNCTIDAGANVFEDGGNPLVCEESGSFGLGFFDAKFRIR